MTPRDKFIECGGQVDKMESDWHLSFRVDPQGTFQTERYMDRQTVVYAARVDTRWDGEPGILNDVFERAVRQMGCLCVCSGKQIRNQNGPTILDRCDIHGVTQ